MSFVLPFSLPSCFFCLSFSLCFLSPPRRPLCRYLPLLRVASSVQQLSVLLEQVCFPSINITFAAFLISLRHLYHVSLQLLFLSSCFLVFLVLWSSRTRYAGWPFTRFLTHEFSFFFFFGHPLSDKSVTT